MPRLIEVENVIRVIDRYISDGDTNLNIKLAITNIPTVDAEPVRHGRWLPYEFATNKRWRKCSVCGTADEYINEYGVEAIRRYCPFCGAKMDEVEA